MRSIDYIQKNWGDDVGSALTDRANGSIGLVNRATSQMAEAISEVNYLLSKEIDFKSRTPEILDIKTRLERELES
ncbi:MAG: hypothetical protein IKD03_00730 [Clostridia bacterium]|nr:hypothetical protein [Clostridia bacterium]